MFVCVCKGVTESQIKQAVINGCTSYAEVRDRLNIGTGCGTCALDAKQIVRSALLSKEQSAVAEKMSYAA